MRDHCAYGLVVCPSSVTVPSSTETANRAVRCQALLSVGMGGSGRPLCGQPARGLSVRCACAVGGVGGGADNRIGAEGAAAVARALESGRCGLTTLDLGGKWGALVLSAAYHCAALQCAALYRYAVLGCFQPRL